MPRILVLGLLVLLTTSAGSFAEPVDSGSSEVLTSSEILNEYLSASAKQRDFLLGMSMQIEVNAKTDKTKKLGTLNAFEHVSVLGTTAYEFIDYVGEVSVRNEIIARYLTAQSRAQNEDPTSLHITPENYKFDYKGLKVREGRALHIFKVEPKRKKIGLFKGELWIDPETFLPFRESGRLVETPLHFLKKVEFVKHYAIYGSMAFPERIDTRIDTRGIGKADITVRYSDFFPYYGVGYAATYASLFADTPNMLPMVILERYFVASQLDQRLSRGMSMEVDIDAKLPKLKKVGFLQALRRVSDVGKISYRVLRFVGDNTIKKDVIARYLTAETQAQEGDGPSIAINPLNYTFKYKGTLGKEKQDLYVFELTPRKKIVGLFKGELWIDSKSYLPVREAGQFVKNPSVFLKKVQFVREYEIRDGMALPRLIESQVETRLVGKAEISIRYRNFSSLEPTQAMGIPVGISH